LTGDSAGCTVLSAVGYPLGTYKVLCCYSVSYSIDDVDEHESVERRVPGPRVAPFTLRQKVLKRRCQLTLSWHEAHTLARRSQTSGFTSTQMRAGQDVTRPHHTHSGTWLIMHVTTEPHTLSWSMGRSGRSAHRPGEGPRTTTATRPVVPMQLARGAGEYIRKFDILTRM
jgi:hypothetical protein